MTKREYYLLLAIVSFVIGVAICSLLASVIEAGRSAAGLI